MLVLKGAVEDEKFLAPAMRVRRKPALRGVADDRGRACHLVADTIEHAPVDPRDRRRHPGEMRRVNDRAL
jgi:hypothetical protein